MSYSARGASPGPHRRPVTPSEVRSVVFTTTRMRLGYDVEEVDSFLDQIEWSMEQMVVEIGRLQRQLGDIDRAHAANLEQARATARQLLALLGGAPVAGGPPGWGTPALPAPQQFQPRRAAQASPPVWNGGPAPTARPGAGSVINGPGPRGPQRPGVAGPPLAATPPPTGRPTTNLPPPTGASVANPQRPAQPVANPQPPTAGGSWTFPPPRS